MKKEKTKKAVNAAGDQERLIKTKDAENEMRKSERVERTPNN